MNLDSKNPSDESIRTELIEAILDYIEGRKNLKYVLAIGITAHSKAVKNPNIAQVASELNQMGNQTANGIKFSTETIRETFTTMLEKLTQG